VVTFKKDPDTVAFIFGATDFSVPANVVDDICFAPRPLNATQSYPCPPRGGWPCLVSQGFQFGFDAIRDQLLPAWQTLIDGAALAQPKRRVLPRVTFLCGTLFLISVNLLFSQVACKYICIIRVPTAW
jgi:hypothetical protein